VLSKAGREAELATLGAGDFFGEECLAGQTLRSDTATAITPSVIQSVGVEAMRRRLHRRHGTSDRFITYQLNRYSQIEENLVAQVLGSTERRLASALLLPMLRELERSPAKGTFTQPKVSQESLPTLVGATRARVNQLLKKFRSLGFVDFSGQLPVTVHNSLVHVVLHD
jgi:CRP/FNR family transcriptional regulator, cyclic AMP receptor protein